MSTGGTRKASAYEAAVIDKCFNGLRARDCGPCVASPWNGGTCCFSDENKFNVPEGSCNSCPHLGPCSTEIERSTTRHNPIVSKFARESPLVQIGGARPVAVSQPVRPTAVVVQRTIPAVAPAVAPSAAVQPRTAQTAVTTQQYASTEETMFKRFWKDVVWGAGEGATQRAAEFFRRYRW